MLNESIPIEDDPCDIIAKAMRGQNISASLLATKAGVSNDIIQSLLAGDNDPVQLTKVADALGLDARSLSNLPNYTPDTLPPEGLHQVVSPFGHAGVNAYVIEHGKSATIIDTGTDAKDLIKLVQSKGLDIARLLITHRHHDHTACMDAFQGTTIVHPEDVDHGDMIESEIGTIKVLDVSGHMSPARAFYYEELDVPICIVGDAVFAGSMGGTSGPSAYELSLKTAQNHLMTLPAETILGPGHGPLTTVRSEQQHNPFLNKCLTTSSHLS